MTTPDVSAAFFEEKYQSREDPWSFASSPSEQQRYSSVLRALQGRRYRQAFEPACSIGVLTEMLAPFCDRLLAVDISPTAAKRAADRCSAFSQVTVTVGPVQAIAPPAATDLLVLSELGYYFSPEEWSHLVRSLLQHCSPDCTMVACHWLGSSPDHRTSGDAVHASLRQQPGLRLEHEERHEAFRLDRFSRVHA